MNIKIILALGLLISGCSSVDAPLEVVSKKVDLSRYMGLWYEIAKLPNSFEAGCTNVTAHYTLKEDKTVRVLNKCILSSDHSVDIAEGKAYVDEPTTNAKLKVSFFGPFYGNYWILHLADDYSYVLIGEPSRKYLWILSRSSTLDTLVYTKLLEIAKNRGFDISKIEKMIHNPPFLAR